MFVVHIPLALIRSIATADEKRFALVYGFFCLGVLLCVLRVLEESWVWGELDMMSRRHTARARYSICFAERGIVMLMLGGACVVVGKSCLLFSLKKRGCAGNCLGCRALEASGV
jgi:hypothetical protein